MIWGTPTEIDEKKVRLYLDYAKNPIQRIVKFKMERLKIKRREKTKPMMSFLLFNELLKNMLQSSKC